VLPINYVIVEVGVCTAIEQQLDGLFGAAPASLMQGAAGVPIHINPGVEKQADDGRVAVNIVERVRVRTGIEEQLDNFFGALLQAASRWLPFPRLTSAPASRRY
jgi:hypothetical protein